jgi:hypothetical protein
MSYWILVFNPRPIHEIESKSVIAALTRSNFRTLCEQYGLDPVLIDLALENLAVRIAPENTALAFLLSYRPEGEPSIAIYRWSYGSDNGLAVRSEATGKAASESVVSNLQGSSQIVGIELSSAQLQDMGLLLGYEAARWAAEQGGGIIRGLDGVWYRLNRHLAFLPIEDISHESR